MSRPVVCFTALPFYACGLTRINLAETCEGKSDGPWVLRHADGRVEEVTYANGKMGDS